MSRGRAAAAAAGGGRTGGTVPIAEQHPDSTTSDARQMSQMSSLPPPSSSVAKSVSTTTSRCSSPGDSSTPAPEPIAPMMPSLHSLPNYINDLSNARKTNGDRPMRALRKLFSMSEHTSFAENRIEMVRAEEGTLIPVLLDFLRRCEAESNEQYLTLLVLNNLSIPPENKRLIALEYDAARSLCRLLCEDPSCHLIAIVLVNLTFAESELRRALVSFEADIEILESLAFALRVSSLTQAEYEHRQPLVENDPLNRKTPRELLQFLLAEDKNQLSASDPRRRMADGPPVLPPAEKQLFPETARWALSAIKNLTRPSRDLTAAHTLIELGIVPHILRFIVVDTMSRNTSMTESDKSGHTENTDTSNTGEDSCNSGDDTPVPSDPTELDTSEGPIRNSGPLDCINAPTTWDDHSAQDAALFVVLNLCTVPSVREYIKEIGSIGLLCHITSCELQQKDESHPFVEEELLEFQRMKARMALSYLLGSEGHFGQPNGLAGTSAKLSSTRCDDDTATALIVTEPEVTRLVELLATTLHRRTKEGAGGYSASTFSVKYVLFSLRCLLTSYENQVKFSNTQGTQLNALLMKVLALHALGSAPYVDAEAAEHASFSLYLMSNYCFQVRKALPYRYAST